MPNVYQMQLHASPAPDPRHACACWEKTPRCSRWWQGRHRQGRQPRCGLTALLRAVPAKQKRAVLVQQLTHAAAWLDQAGAPAEVAAAQWARQLRQALVLTAAGRRWAQQQVQAVAADTLLSKQLRQLRRVAATLVVWIQQAQKLVE